jgi:predicted MFS family arabinose efflux permease
MLTLGGVICVCARLFVGWLADRWNRGHLCMVAAMLAIGASGIALFGLRRPAASLLGVTLGYGLGWCWPGLLTFSVARLRPQTPAAVTPSPRPRASCSWAAS